MTIPPLRRMAEEAESEDLLKFIGECSGALEVAKTRLAAPVAAQAEEPDFTAEEAAAALNVPRRAVYDFARRVIDPLPARSMGNRKRFPRRELAAWQKRQG